MFGLFLENGPMRVTMGPNGPDDFQLLPADKAWTDSYNVIFLDQPVSVGFSFGDTAGLNMEVGANEFYSFILQFYEMYPEMKTVDFHITGESYAGKYIPLFSKTILEANT